MGPEQNADPFHTESATTPGAVTREQLDAAATMISIGTAGTSFSTSQQILHQYQGLGAEVVLGNQLDDHSSDKLATRRVGTP